MAIMNKGLRETIKVALIKKYIDDLGIEIPKLPSKPTFEMPPMPDLGSLISDAAAAADKAVNDRKNDLFTEEYIKAVDVYNQKLEAAAESYKAVVDELDRVKEEYDKVGGTAEEIGEFDRKLGQMLSTVTSRLGTDTSSVTYDNLIKERRRMLGEAKDKFNDEKKKAREESEIDKVKKFKKLKGTDKEAAAEASEKETESKREKAKSVAMAAMQISIVKQYEAYIRKELEVINRLFTELLELFNDTKDLFVNGTKAIKDYFKEEGDGGKWVEQECDKIDRIWENMADLFKELGVDISTMIGKIPNPDVVVAGAATGMPNPGHKIMVFMENFKKVMTDITKIVNYVKEMLALAKAMGFDLSKIQAFAMIMKLIEKLRGDADKQFRNAVKKFRKKTKWVAEINKKDEDDDDEYKTKKAGYKYADIEVDYENYEITLLGYKCYCTKNKEFIEGYEKNKGPYTDNKGKRYYYLKEDDIYNDEEDYSDEADGETVATPSYDYKNNTTKLQLSDGRIVTIDYLAESGDIIKLNDGTIVNVL